MALSPIAQELVKQMLKSEVDPSAYDNYAIRWAARKGRTEVVELLSGDSRVDLGARGAKKKYQTIDSMSLAFTETFLSSLNSFKVKKYDENSLKCSKNYSSSRVILPESVKVDTITLKFNKVPTEISIKSLDFIITIKKLLNLEKKYTLLKKGKVLKDYKCALDYDLQNGDVLTIFYQKEQVKQVKSELVKEIVAMEIPKQEIIQENSEKKKFIKELRLLLEKYKLQTLEKDIVNLLPKDY